MELRENPYEDSRRLLSGQAIHKSEKKTGCIRSDAGGRSFHRTADRSLDNAALSNVAVNPFN